MNNNKHVEQTSCDAHTPLPRHTAISRHWQHFWDLQSWDEPNAAVHWPLCLVPNPEKHLDLSNLYGKHSWSFLIQVPHWFCRCGDSWRSSCAPLSQQSLSHPKGPGGASSGRQTHPTSSLIYPASQRPALLERVEGWFQAACRQWSCFLSLVHWEPVNTCTSRQENPAPS